MLSMWSNDDIKAKILDLLRSKDIVSLMAVINDSGEGLAPIQFQAMTRTKDRLLWRRHFIILRLSVM